METQVGYVQFHSGSLFAWNCLWSQVLLHGFWWEFECEGYTKWNSAADYFWGLFLVVSVWLLLLHQHERCWSNNGCLIFELRTNTIIWIILINIISEPVVWLVIFSYIMRFLLCFFAPNLDNTFKKFFVLNLNTDLVFLRLFFLAQLEFRAPLSGFLKGMLYKCLIRMN